MSKQSASTTSEYAFGRRAFLGGSATVIGAFVLEAAPVTKMAQAIGAAQAAAGANTAVNGWIAINADNTATISFGGAEMGQGIMTGLAQAAAEELGMAWSQIRTQAAPAAQGYVTGGSFGIRGHLDQMRTAGAQAQSVLVSAAATSWGVAPTACTVANGIVTNTSTGATQTFAQLAAAAATLTPPTSPALKNPSAFGIIGTSAPRTDIPSKTDGSAVFGIDVVLPGMVYAAIKHCPTVGGTVSGTPATPSGASAVVPLGGAVAVVASNTWAAMQAARNLSVTWSVPAGNQSISSASLLADAQSLMATGTPGSPIELQTGDAAGAFAAASTKVDATYQVPYLPHVYMEVLNCTVNITPTSCEIWASTQAPAWIQATAAAMTGLDPSAVTVHATLLGGGLGRKIELDYVVQAITIAKTIGKPVKLTWSREEDMSHDQYRPAALINVKLGMDAAGSVTSYGVRHVSQSPLFQRGWTGPTGNDNTDGAADVAYQFPNALMEYVMQKSAVPVGFWRSVGVSMNCFAVESAIDEAAKLAGKDPVAFRRTLLAGKTRELAVLNKAADMIGWTTAPASGVGRGIAFSNGFGSLAAVAVEVTKGGTGGTMAVTKVAFAVDCGFAVNPNQVEAQIQGGIIQGITSGLWGQTTFANGQASSRNFSNTRMLLMRETPTINVAIIQSGLDKIGGIGEVAVPPMAPAMANAWASLTGTRVRNLPFYPGATMSD